MRTLLVAVMLAGCAGVVEPSADAGAVVDAAPVADANDCWAEPVGHWMCCNNGTFCCYDHTSTSPCSGAGEWYCVASDGVESCVAR